MSQTLLLLISHIDSHTMTVGDLNTLISPIVRSTRQKINRNAGGNWCYRPSGANRYLPNIQPKEKRISLLSISEDFLQNWWHSCTQSKPQQKQENGNNTLQAEKLENDYQFDPKINQKKSSRIIFIFMTNIFQFFPVKSFLLEDRVLSFFFFFFFWDWTVQGGSSQRL